MTSGSFTAIGALSSCVLAWFDMQKKMYRENSINEQVEVAAVVGDFALYNGKPVVHTHMVVGHRDGSASAGGPNQLELMERPDLKANESTAIVKIAGSAVNPSDVKNVAGRMQQTTLPRVPGRDYSGVRWTSTITNRG